MTQHDGLSLKIGMIFLFFAVSLGGALLPVYAPPEVFKGHALPVLSACSAGIMMGIALCHLLPEGDELLSEAWPTYRLAFALVGVGVALVLSIEQMTLSLMAHWRDIGSNEVVAVKRSEVKSMEQADPCCSTAIGCKDAGDLEEGDGDEGSQPVSVCQTDDSYHKEPSVLLPQYDHDHSHAHELHEQHEHSAACGHTHGLDVLQELNKASSMKDLVFLYALELSVAVHSIILGVQFGLESEWKTLTALCIALSFHQTIEGIAIGSTIADFKSLLTQWKVMAFMGIFASTISIGVIIGIGSSYGEETEGSNVAQGVVSTLAAGSLLYVSLAEQVNIYFGRSDLQKKAGVKALMILAFCAGFAFMAVLAIWE